MAFFQPKPASDSPLFNGNATDCEAIPNCVLSSVTSDARGALRSLTDSPAYDNVTLDDLLAASTSWAEYLHKESERIEGDGSCRTIRILFRLSVLTFSFLSFPFSLSNMPSSSTQ